MAARLRRVKASEARQQFSGMLKEVYDRQARVIVERSGIPVAAIVSPEDLANIERVEAEQQERRSDVQTTTVAEIREIILPVLRRHGITRAGLFGSIVRGEAGPESDVDVLVELEARASLLDFIGVKLDLEDVLGRRVDLVQYAAIKPALRDRILGEEIRLV